MTTPENVFDRWAADWSVPAAAVADLRRRVAEGMTPALTVKSGPLESAVQSAVRVEASRKGVLLMRNNVGAVRTPTGFIRYGLANDSETINRVNKSSDLIGVRPVLITADHVGRTIGQLVCRECKRADWRFGQGDRERENAQLNFLLAMLAYGADACFASGEGTL